MSQPSLPAIFGHRTLIKQLRLNETIKVGPEPERIGFLLDEAQSMVSLLPSHTALHTHQGEAMVRGSCLEAGKGTLTSIQPDNTLNMDFQSPKWQDNRCLLFKLTGLW